MSIEVCECHLVLLLCAALSGMMDVSSCLVNTDWKCWLSVLALVRLSDLMNLFLSCSC